MMGSLWDGRRWEKVRRSLFCRLCRTPRDWHNREFTRSQTIERTGDGGFLVRWQGHGEVRARPLDELPRHGERCTIVASGPSISRLERRERMFRTPAACVNGSVLLAQQLGVRIAYYFVSDPSFVERESDLFAMGAELADAVVLNPKTVFTAMQCLPGLLERVPVYLREDIKRPFKRPRPSRAEMQRDSSLLVHAKRAMAYSLDPVAGTYPAGTVVYDAVQVLFGIGCRRIFMFGVDLSSQGRFYCKAISSSRWLDRSYPTIVLPAFELVRTYCQRTGKELLNCSMDSRLPASVVPKLDGMEALAMLERESSPGAPASVTSSLPHSYRPNSPCVRIQSRSRSGQVEVPGMPAASPTPCGPAR